MTDALVEAVARAMAGAEWNASNGLDKLLYETVEQAADYEWQNFQRSATAALQAIEAAGYRVVPVEATRKMRLAGEKEMMARHTNLDCFRDPYVDSTYAAMLSAAPRVEEG